MNFLCFSLLVKIILDTVCYCNVFIFFYLMCGLKKHVKKLEIKKKNCNTGKEFVSTPTLIKYNYKKIIINGGLLKLLLFYFLFNNNNNNNNNKLFNRKLGKITLVLP